jgi:hypothetical protein
MASAGSNGIIKGRVLDQAKQPVEYATAALLDAKTNQLITGSLCNDQGEFVIVKVPAGDYKLSISMVGYQKAETEVFSVTDSTHLIIDKPIVLNESIMQLPEATVTAHRNFIEQKEDKMIINPEASITTSSDNVMDILKKLPGVSVDNDQNISLKGKQGVIIMIDDKPTYLSADQLANLLKSIQGKNVERIEIIENPSARYDAEGNSGIINIKTKHTKVSGFSGTVFGGLSFSNKPGENGGIDLSMHTGKLNLYGSYSFNEWRGWNSIDADRQYMSGANQGAYQQVSSYTHFLGNADNFKVGADYNITTNQVLSVMVRGTTGFNNGIGNTQNDFLNTSHQLDSTLNTKLGLNDNWQNYSYNANYKWNIDSTGQSLTLDADYAQYLYDAVNTQGSNFVNATGENLNSDFGMIQSQKNTINILSAKADYVYPVNKAITIESGIKASLVTNDGRTDINVNDPTGIIWSNGLKQHDRFIYNENINAAYIIGHGQFGKNSLQLGLRIENTNSKGNSESMDRTDQDHYTNLFPSLFLQHTFNDDNKLGFSYSYRIGRPNYDLLNPFLYMLDPYTYLHGNPFLKPQYTNALSLNYTYKGKWITSIGYDNTRNLFTQLLLQNDQTNVIYFTDQNLSKSIDFNISETAQIDFAKWWHFNATAIGMYKRVVSNVAGAIPFSRLSYSVNMSNTFTLPRNWSLELTGRYQSAQLNGNVTLLQQYQINVGVQKSLLNNKATLKLSVDDLLDTNKGGEIAEYGNVNIHLINRWDSRKLNVSFSYRFGKDNFKTRADRVTSSSEEEGRSAK